MQFIVVRNDVQLSDEKLRNNIAQKLGIPPENEDIQDCLNYVKDSIAKRELLTICELSAVGSASDISVSILDALRNGKLLC